MSPLSVGLVVFVCTFGGAIAGIALRGKLPEHHQDSESKDVLKLVMALISTVSALVLGLLIASGHGSYRTQTAEVQRLGVNIVQLDHALEHYGPEASEARNLLRQMAVAELNRMWPNDGATEEAPPTRESGEELAERIASLSPKTDLQQFTKSRALQLLTQMGETRGLLYEESSGSLSWLFLVILVFWLVALFVGFGLLARYNATVVTALFVGAFAVGGAVFLILETNQPYTGLMKISSIPMQRAIAAIGH